MFALTVEKISRYEYKSKKEAKGSKKASKGDLKDVVSRAVDEQALCVNSDTARGAYRSPIMARRKLRLLQMSAGPRSASPHRLSLASTLTALSLDVDEKSGQSSPS